MAVIQKLIRLAGSKGSKEEVAVFDNGATFSCLRPELAERLASDEISSLNCPFLQAPISGMGALFFRHLGLRSDCGQARKYHTKEAKDDDEVGDTSTPPGLPLRNAHLSKERFPCLTCVR